jgi:hypothetical protein
MPQVIIKGGALMDVPDQREIAAIVSAQLREHARGIKFMQLPVYLQGKPSGSAITLGVTKGHPPVGPEQGYMWGITRLVVTGLSTTGPDIVNIYLNDNFGGPVWWQFNGNNFGYNFAPPLVLQAGSTLAMQNSGTITATGLITLSGELWEVPAEQSWRLLGLS